MNSKSSEEKSEIKLSLAHAVSARASEKRIWIFYFSGERSVCVEQQIDDKTKKVEVILSSYHSAIEFR